MTTLEELFDRFSSYLNYVTKEQFLSLCQSSEFREALLGECEWKLVHTSDTYDYHRISCTGQKHFANALDYSKRPYCPFCGGKIKEVK